MDSKSGPRSEGGDWTGYFVSGQEAIGYGYGFLALAKQLREMDFSTIANRDKQLIWNIHATLQEWGDRFLQAEEK